MIDGVTIYKKTKKAVLDGYQCNYFSQTNFDNYIGGLEKEFPNLETLIIDGVENQKKSKKKNIINLSSLTKLKNLKKLSFKSDFEALGYFVEELKFFNFDSFPVLAKLEFLELEGDIDNYYFIQHLKNLHKLVIWHSNNSKGKLFLKTNTNPLLNLKILELRWTEICLVKEFAIHADMLPNLEELTLEGFTDEEEGGDHYVNPTDIVKFKKLKILRMPSSHFLPGSYQKNEEELNWCSKRELINLANLYSSKPDLDWRYLGQVWYERSSVSIIDSKYLPYNFKKKVNIFKNFNKLYKDIEDFLISHGSNYSFQYNRIYLRYGNDRKLDEIHILDDIDADNEKDLRLYNYENFEKELKKNYPDNKFVLSEEKIHSFKIETNKMVILDMFEGLHNDEQTTDIDSESYSLECSNGMYDVYSMSTKANRKKSNLENIKIKFSCCDSVHNFSKDMIVKKHGVEWFKCEKCIKLIGGFNEKIHEMMVDEKGQKIDFSIYEVEGHDYLPSGSYGTCYGFAIRRSSSGISKKEKPEVAYVKNCQMADNGTYTGEMINGLPHGKGSHIWEATLNKLTYKGEYKEGMRHGKGMMKDSSSGEELCNGYWKDDKLEGKGRSVDFDKNGKKIVYEGEFKANEYHGEGRQSWTDKDGEEVVYEGGFKDGKFHGHGRHIQKHCEQVGEFRNNVPHGKGVFTLFATNQKMIGTWKNGELIKEDIESFSEKEVN